MKRGFVEKTEQLNTDLKKRFAILLTCFIFSSILVSLCCGNSILDLKALGPFYKNIDTVIIESMRKDLKIIFLVLIGMIITILFINRKEKITAKKTNNKHIATTFLFVAVFVIFNLVSYRNYIVFSNKTTVRERRFEDFMLCKQTYECKKYLDKVIAVHQEFMMTEYELKSRNRSDEIDNNFRGEAQNYSILTSY